MTGPASECPRCGGRLAESWFVCSACVDKAEQACWDVAQFALWADDKRARVRSPMGGSGGGRPRETPLPFDPRVTPALRAAAATVGKGVAASRKAGPESSYPTGPGLSQLAAWLMTRCAWAASRPWIVDLVEALEFVADDLRRLWDNPPDRVYLGRCGAVLDEVRTCGASLYSDLPVMSVVRCPQCETHHDTRSLRGELAEAVDGYLGTAREIARLLSLTLGDDASERSVWAYARRGLILPRGERMEQDIKGRARRVSVYRIGEVRRAAERARREEEARRLQRRLDRSRRAVAAMERHADKGA